MRPVFGLKGGRQTPSSSSSVRRRRMERPSLDSDDDATSDEMGARGSRGAGSIVSMPTRIGAAALVSVIPVKGLSVSTGSTRTSPVSVSLIEASTSGEVMGPAASVSPAGIARIGVSAATSVMEVEGRPATGVSGVLVPPGPLGSRRIGSPGVGAAVAAGGVATIVSMGRPTSGASGSFGFRGLLQIPWKFVKFVCEVLSGALQDRPVAYASCLSSLSQLPSL
mmetsp:Transcript_7946/g.21191  ORF Transcript_7946/g.21191 Transcript_7946/m.21191 type:complete len:223 (+) Transcript_7946:18413-19081(+)